MSRIGKIPIEIPDGVKAEIKDSTLSIKGPLGELIQSIHPFITVEPENGRILVKRKDETKFSRSLHGLFQRLITNMVTGVTKGYEKKLEIQGVGYKAKVEGKTLILQLGFSHLVKYEMPEGIKITVTDNTKIGVTGLDKQKVGEASAIIRRYYPPEPYKGKGIRYVGEYVRRKAGKAAAAKGAPKAA